MQFLGVTILQGVEFDFCMGLTTVQRDCAACDIMVNILTHGHTVRQTHRQTERQLLTGCSISCSGSLANKNSKHVISVTSFVISMTLCYINVKNTSVL